MQRLATAVLAEQAQVMKRVAGVQKAWPQVAEDVKQQCARLLQAGFLARTPWGRLQHFPRYLKAATLRLDKLRTDPARDAQRAAELVPLEQAFRRELASRAKLGGAASAAVELEQFGWLLEELRVSLCRPGAAHAGAGLLEATGQAVAKYPQMGQAVAKVSANEHRMSHVFSSLAFAFVNLLHPRMLWLMIWPVLVALFLWGLAAFLYWTSVALWLAGHFRQWIESGVFFVRFDGGDALLFAAHVILVLLFVPAVYLTALVILSVFGMTKWSSTSLPAAFPGLRAGGGGIAGSVWNGIVALAGMALLAIVTPAAVGDSAALAADSRGHLRLGEPAGAAL